MISNMQNQILAFTGYNESNVRSAIETIQKNSFNFKIRIDGKARKENGLITNQPLLRGCYNEDLKVYSLIINGTLVNMRNLIKMQTPYGVQIDLLPTSA